MEQEKFIHVLFLCKRRIYWSDWERGNPRIETSNMDGSDRKVFLNSSYVGLPNGLVIDYGSEELCWTDALMHDVKCTSLNKPEQVRRITNYKVSILIDSKMSTKHPN